MNKILENIKDFLFFITHPKYWITTVCYNEEYDRLFNELLDKYEFSDYDYWTVKLGNSMFFVGDTAEFCTYKINDSCDNDMGTLRPSRKTMYKAVKKLIKYNLKTELNKIKTP